MSDRPTLEELQALLHQSRWPRQPNYIKIETADADIVNAIWSINTQECKISQRLQKGGDPPHQLLWVVLSNPGLFPSVAAIVVKILDNHKVEKKNPSDHKTKLSISSSKRGKKLADKASEMLGAYIGQDQDTDVKDEDETDSDVNPSDDIDDESSEP